MSEWMYNLPVAWMAVVVLLATYVATGCLYALIMAAAKGERARVFKAVSPGMLPPLGIIFGLFVAFLAAQVWRDFDQAQAAVSREASALRAVVLLIESFPGDPCIRAVVVNSVSSRPKCRCCTPLTMYCQRYALTRRPLIACCSSSLKLRSQSLRKYAESNAACPCIMPSTAPTRSIRSLTAASRSSGVSQRRNRNGGKSFHDIDVPCGFDNSRGDFRL